VSAVKNLPPDEYGIVFWMVKNKSSLIKDVINDHGGIEAIEVLIKEIIIINM